ncbi:MULTISPECIES: helix-turn-helix transcriptional regulator [unclassified Pseudoalteromonas]|uniref:helix-turn-helix transcriptional regulator n=1 Tax=unclassified Pseudoalteromonas TaxID=194690 RepID=UPI0025B756A1|nr:helix-turn-helix transcriptional regulator [Pseudoalteromonas sp. XMcav2-N]
MTLDSKHLVQQLRLSGPYSVIQFAKKLGVSKQTVYNWESGKTAPDLPQLIRMYIVCGLNPRSLLPQKKQQEEEVSKDLGISE